MKKNKLLNKFIFPIVLLGILASFLGFVYLNTFIKEPINEEINQKLDNRINFVMTNIESEFKLLFYLYGTKDNYKKRENIFKKEIIDQLKYELQTSKDIVYIIENNNYIPLSPLTIPKKLLKNLKNDIITINNKKYKIKQLYFKPWNWRIVYLLDISNFNTILYKNKIILFSVIFILLFVLIVIILIVFKMYIKNPIEVIMKHFDLMSEGKYLYIKDKFNIEEIDKLISNINNMTQAIKSREEELTKVLDYTQNILDSQNSIILINNTTEILDVNKSFFDFFNEFKTLEEFKKQHNCICDYFVKEEGYTYKFEDKNWVEYLLQDKDNVHKVKILRKNKYHIFAIQAKRFNKYNQIIITMTDITELERSNNLLEQYKKAVDASAIVSKTDINGIITYVNDNFLQISGYTKNELIGTKHNIIKSSNTPESLFKNMWETISSKKIWKGIIENRKKDGLPYFVSATIIPILDENGEIIEYMGITFDITKQILAIEKAKQAQKAKGLFLANMSHEIRTPLNAIIGFTTILKKSSLNDKEKNYVNIIDQSSKHLLEIVNDILDFSKIESGNFNFEKKEFDSFKEFNGIIDLFVAKAYESKLTLISHIDPKIPTKLIGDSLRIRQVLSNLISNAIKFSTENNDVIIDIKLVSQKENKCRIYFCVQDFGIGIPKDKQKLIFKEFSQSDDSISREYGGTGLGLSISSKIIEALGSKIYLESEEKKGSKFYFELDFEISNTDNLEQLKYLNVGIIKSNEIQNYDFRQLKEYLDWLVNCKIYTNSEQIENDDIIIVDETNIDDNIKKLDKLNKNKILVLSNKNKKIEGLINAEVIYIPFNRLEIFNILMSLIEKKQISNIDIKNNKFKGKVLIAEDYITNQQLISTLLDIRGIEYKIVENGQEAVDEFKNNKYDLVLMDINMPIKDGNIATLEIRDYMKKNNISIPIVALSANAIELNKGIEKKFDDYILKPIEEEKLDNILQKYL